MYERSKCMTVIIGVRTTIGEPAVVLASDRLSVRGKHDLPEFMLAWEERSKLELSFILSHLQHIDMDKIQLRSTRKIRTNQTRALAHTGSIGYADEKIAQLLLDRETFFTDKAYLQEILFPFLLMKIFMKKKLKNILLPLILYSVFRCRIFRRFEEFLIERQ